MRYLQGYEEKKAITGKISYHLPSRAWTILRFKKEFLKQFPELKTRMGEFEYELIPFLYWEALMSYLEKARKNGQVPPNLLWLKGNTN